MLQLIQNLYTQLNDQQLKDEFSKLFSAEVNTEGIVHMECLICNKAFENFDYVKKHHVSKHSDEISKREKIVTIFLIQMMLQAQSQYMYENDIEKYIPKPRE